MPVQDVEAGHESGSLSLIARRQIAAPPDVVFAAWTEPEQLKRWWGPKGVTCPQAEMDLRVGGRYRLANQLADGNTVWITGVFDQIQRPHKLVYTWAHEPLGEDTEHTRVTVRFEPRGKGTEVIVVHERFATRASRDRHAAGWEGCLDGLVRLLGAAQAL
jgi:uncharacterized protein YndB with AHSA1/START domain